MDKLIRRCLQVSHRDTKVHFTGHFLTPSELLGVSLILTAGAKPNPPPEEDGFVLKLKVVGLVLMS